MESSCILGLQQPFLMKWRFLIKIGVLFPAFLFFQKKGGKNAPLLFLNNNRNKLKRFVSGIDEAVGMTVIHIGCHTC